MKERITQAMILIGLGGLAIFAFQFYTDLGGWWLLYLGAVLALIFAIVVLVLNWAYDHGHAHGRAAREADELVDLFEEIIR